MTNEAVRVEGPYLTRDFAISGVTAIPQGTLMVLSDPRTAVASAVGNDAPIFAGITATDKTAGDVATEHGCDVKGVHLLTAAGAEVTVGHMVVISGVNTIRNAINTELLTGAVVGKAYETIAAGTTGEVSVGECV